MATTTRRKTRSKARSRNNGKSAGYGAGSGVHVKRDTSNPHVARITVEIDWDELISRVAKKMGQTIRKRRARGARRSQRTSAAR